MKVGIRKANSLDANDIIKINIEVNMRKLLKNVLIQQMNISLLQSMIILLGLQDMEKTKKILMMNILKYLHYMLIRIIDVITLVKNC